jgi:hypothetical protein
LQSIHRWQVSVEIDHRKIVTALICNGTIVRRRTKIIPEQPEEPQQMHILVVEDDPLQQAVLASVLSKDIVRPRMIALTAVSGRLSKMQIKSGSPFDEIVEKSSDLSALLAVIDRQLRSAPDPATRHAAETMSLLISAR